MKKAYTYIILLAILTTSYSAISQHSVAREWNELLLEAIRNDFARPTVHSRNLFHTSVAMYDMWATFDETATTFMLGKNVDNFTCPFDSFPMPANLDSARNVAISYAMYRVLYHRFIGSPGSADVIPLFNAYLEDSLGLDKTFTSIDYSTGSPAALGNYMADCIINFGLQDGSNEQFSYGNAYYNPVNQALLPELPGNPTITNVNRWQPLSFDFFIDQSGNPFPFNVPPFLGPEWGLVEPFALSTNDLKIKSRDGEDWWVYHDPGVPPKINVNTNGGLSEEYKWGFEMVAMWSSHLGPADTTMIDISPNSFGNLDISTYPQTFPEYRTFYDSTFGGDHSPGRNMNPVTGMPYDSNFVKRSDYTRVLAEFWADGPDSETPPGHWFTLLNYVNDHPLFEKKYMGQGPVIDDLEWDVKAYFTMAGAMHDAAVSSWGIKGFYDYLRPISAIRLLCDIGQCSTDTLPNYNPAGIHLLTGFIENVFPGDSLAGENNEHVNKIKLYAWRGPDYISNEETDTAGVGWILAENWWPYQRPTFVTPPFAGYVSGHSTFSRAAAEIMTLLTGCEYFPGGMGEFLAPKNNFLVFEKGPSEDVHLQWATYQDASDQTSLSRIWGGIHPPCDDIPGRLIGYDIGHEAFELANKYFDGITTLYVDDDVTISGDGLSWDSAIKDLKPALDTAQKYRSIDEIKIAGGTYKRGGANRSNAFKMVSGVKITGGYTANINDSEERNLITHPTFISGEIITAALTDNLYHVLIIDKLDNNAIIEGVKIVNGYADGPETDEKVGAAIYNEGQVTLIDVTIENCFGVSSGSLIYNVGGEGDLKMENCEVKE